MHPLLCSESVITNVVSPVILFYLKPQRRQGLNSSWSKSTNSCRISHQPGRNVLSSDCEKYISFTLGTFSSPVLILLHLEIFGPPKETLRSVFVVPEITSCLAKHFLLIALLVYSVDNFSTGSKLLSG